MKLFRHSDTLTNESWIDIPAAWSAMNKEYLMQFSNLKMTLN